MTPSGPGRGRVLFGRCQAGPVCHSTPLVMPRSPRIVPDQLDLGSAWRRSATRSELALPIDFTAGRTRSDTCAAPGKPTPRRLSHGSAPKCETGARSSATMPQKRARLGCRRSHSLGPTGVSPPWTDTRPGSTATSAPGTAPTWRSPADPHHVKGCRPEHSRHYARHSWPLGHVQPESPPGRR